MRPGAVDNGINLEGIPMSRTSVSTPVKDWRWWWTMPLLIFVGMTGPGLLGLADAEADPIQDVAFLETLDAEGITYASASKVIDAGHAVCDYLDDGWMPLDVAWEVAEITGLPSATSAYFVGASIGAFCDEYMPLVMGGVNA